MTRTVTYVQGWIVDDDSKETLAMYGGGTVEDMRNILEHEAERFRDQGLRVTSDLRASTVPSDFPGTGYWFKDEFKSDTPSQILFP